MKTIILAFAVLAVSTAAFAQSDGSGPVRRGDRCWSESDQRGFGFWDRCAGMDLQAARNKYHGQDRNIPQPMTMPQGVKDGGSGGGGGGGG